MVFLFKNNIYIKLPNKIKFADLIKKCLFEFTIHLIVRVFIMNFFSNK